MLHHDVLETPSSVTTKIVVAVGLKKALDIVPQNVVLRNADDLRTRGRLLNTSTPSSASIH